MSDTVYVLNGPNLNLLGTRQPEIYGHDTLEDVQRLCEEVCTANRATLEFHQSNAEHLLIDWIQEARRSRGLVINPAGYTTTSVAIRDALLTCDCPIYEVHISNIHKREAFRHNSYVSGVANGVIAGFGILGYRYAVERIFA
ncbi:type II 3-dehydroquinate dehydratase [Pelagibacterium xiamenense]|uniref:type II 3-dehydroquinate dehydratase n=1 Tax=Pelagibacterium xiamenense TaxID=2901140 RepID=UPI001E5A5FF9|nr:type II 3-dehydroquinate dehydratase [Pelagibacterium xiamenense]MCD7059584.1 type II 3-dehydroquinate dehydratase [Pelagibacterium xiamenense]